MIKLGILEGSLRKASLSRAVARAAATLAPEGFSCVALPSTGTLPLYNQDTFDEGLPDSASAMLAAVADIDALLIVTPEYNWSMPGSLKNAIDWISRDTSNPLAGKPVTIWSVSPGLLGGARVHEGLRHVLHSLDMQIMAKPEVQVAGAKGKVDVEAGTITNPDTEAFLRGHLSGFHTFCTKWGAGNA
ncbi:NADPH-dependent FMN reductase [Flavimaricola marinus]|uniref:NADPH azoreductase n=1 Tax=Flavimaricola marinus TaxID=1819565 RepID=A0A238LET8_9RHOB|nr:NADPH-dependent FMN reductase [Flavimaricola marinus]SMY07430.1 NADPH azoreductase [Flavimaricola marinus]